MIFDELKTRGVKDVLLTCCDNLKGISESLKITLPGNVLSFGETLK